MSRTIPPPIDKRLCVRRIVDAGRPCPRADRYLTDPRQTWAGRHGGGVSGQSFTLITTTGPLTGNFGTVALPVLPLGMSWVQQQTATSPSISFSGSLAADLFVWQRSLG